ncbi:MAG: FAD-dependent oxidoreductase [Patescibacteria group bacterium]|nr:FAD-dependent oxidoreductase [Patescibacteria group bacterium]
MKFKVKLLDRRDVAEGTKAIFFEKPPAFSFKAGQYCDFTLVDPPETDAEGNVRTFSLAGAPFEDRIMIATRMRDSAFKRVLAAMPIGGEIQMEGPMGSMTLQNDASRPAVFLAGGIGITPFRSIIANAAHEKLPHEIWLFYSNRRPEDAAFLGELGDLEKQNPHFRLVGTMTGMENSKQKWNGETGYIDGEMLKRHLDDIAKPIYYVAGPPTMTMAMRVALNGIGVDDDYIKSEEFAGY